MIKVTNLHKSFGSNHVLTGIDEVINDGEVVSIIGPSGSGKSTFLRCLNLLETPNEGVIEFDDEVVYIREAYGVKEELKELKANKNNYSKEDYNKKISEKGTIKRLLDTLVERIEINSKTNEPTLIYVESFEKLYKLYKEN